MRVSDKSDRWLEASEDDFTYRQQARHFAEKKNYNKICKSAPPIHIQAAGY